MRCRALSLVASMVVLATSAASCLSPTLPLPPPTIDSVSEGVTSGVWAISGTCEANAFVEVLNTNLPHDLGAVVQCSAVGVYQVPITGKLCDLLVAQQNLGESASDETRFVLEPFQNDAPVDPNACR